MNVQHALKDTLTGLYFVKVGHTYLLHDHLLTLGTLDEASLSRKKGPVTAGRNGRIKTFKRVDKRPATHLNMADAFVNDRKHLKDYGLVSVEVELTVKERT